MRAEGDAIDAALDETFRIGREAHIPVEIWHLKVAGKANWGRMPQIVKRIEDARADPQGRADAFHGLGQRVERGFGT
jgi:N-acyl-D-amino-acid deacylase